MIIVKIVANFISDGSCLKTTYYGVSAGAFEAAIIIEFIVPYVELIDTMLRGRLWSWEGFRVEGIVES